MCVCAGRRCGTPGCRGRALEPVLSEAAGVDWRRFRLQARCVVAVLLCAVRLAVPVRSAQQELLPAGVAYRFMACFRGAP